MTNANDFPDLDALYAAPSAHVQKAVMPHLLPFHVTYLGAATFFCLATGRAQGLDASPRGGMPGFVHVLDPRAALLTRLTENGKRPKTAIRLHIDEVLFHCGKAINRARLWQPASLIDRHMLPTPGQMLAAMTGQDDATARAIDMHYEQGVKTDLY